MKDFGRWFQEQSLPAQKPADSAQPMLPVGVFDRNGKYFATCRSCERNYELCFEPEEFDNETNYCASSPRCMP